MDLYALDLAVGVDVEAAEFLVGLQEGNFGSAELLGAERVELTILHVVVLVLDLCVNDSQVGFEDVVAYGEELMQVEIISLFFLVDLDCSVCCVCCVLVGGMFLGVSWYVHPKETDRQK